ncbi:hypothetical protein F5144DRAFT_19664 [Chaetomium tenue]|uniref:Uncharacterized protein n=1 Tax=Chaetomium tenue TaxID=1854479 RepID=A0ACB7PNB3_9PEZI|nr:hypothetical protein F5144DRAFT_19664 [Chaetomium globosum]
MVNVATPRLYGALGADDSPKPRSIKEDLDWDIRLGCGLHRVSAKHPAAVHNSAELIQNAAVACLGHDDIAVDIRSVWLGRHSPFAWLIDATRGPPWWCGLTVHQWFVCNL